MYTPNDHLPTAIDEILFAWTLKADGKLTLVTLRQ